MSETEDAPDTETLLKRLGQKLTGDDDGSESTESDAGQKGEEPDADADQKQPPDDGGGDDPDAEDVREDLIAALAEEMNADPAEVREAVAQLANDEMDDGEDDEDDEDDDAGQEADGDTEVNIDFGAKLDEHGVLTEDDLSDVVTADDLGEKMDSLREDIVDDLGQKLAETNEEAVEEIAQKMQSTSTDSPAGGSFQDEKDFEAALDEVADKEGWA